MKMTLFVTVGDIIGLILVVAIIVAVVAVYGMAVLIDRWEKRQQKKSEKFWEDKQ